MRLGFRRLTGVLIIVAAAIGFSSAATAQITSSGGSNGLGEVNGLFNDAYFENDVEFFNNHRIGRQIDLIFGVGSLDGNSYLESEINRDGELLDLLYQDILYQQVSADPILRTPDLPNPYNSSLLVSPRYNVNNQMAGAEFMFETLPPR